MFDAYSLDLLFDPDGGSTFLQSFCQTTRRHILEDTTFLSHRRENLKSCID
jgi:hypothetical protein